MPIFQNKVRLVLILTACGSVALFLGIRKPAPPPTAGGEARESSPEVSRNPRVTEISSSFAAITGIADSSKASLTDLAKHLESLPTDEAVAEIREFLRSGRDKETGVPFEIGRDGTLTGWPTFRVFLLDLLAKIDPAAAAEISRNILTTPTSADEWAIALRNIGRFDSTPESAALLREKTVQLINQPEWRGNPSVGYLNAFDVLVHTEATSETPLLSDLIQRKDRKDLAHAGFLTLDRLVQRAPADMLERLAADAGLHQSRPEMTAQQFARADLRDPAQQDIVKKWLLDPSRTPVELRSFASTYPNANHFVSNNLLTTEKVVTGAELAAHDREAIAIISAWEQDAGFQPIREHLRAILARLDGFVNGPKQDSPSEP